MSYEAYQEAKEFFCDALEAVLREGGKITAEKVRLAKDAIGGLYKTTILIEMEDGGESYDGGMSYARRRDGRGRYSREGGRNDNGGRGGNRGGNYGESYRSRYSRDEAKKDMAEEIKELMQYADNETEKSVLRQAAEMLKNNAEK